MWKETVFMVIVSLLTVVFIDTAIPNGKFGFKEMITRVYGDIGGETPLPPVGISINYLNKNMTIEFKEGETILGESTLKSHNTYNEIRRVTTGKNKTVVWYEFSGFDKDYLSALKGVEFIDMREIIENKTYTSQFKEDEFEKMNNSLVLIRNPNYLLLIEKNYTFVYKNEGKWLPYNSFNIPKENITIGVQTDLGWGEFLDVQLNILENKLDRHALVLGTNSGFVTTAPVDDPLGAAQSVIDAAAFVTKDTSPATATKITEIGWWLDSASEEANFEVGLYAADGAVVPGEAGTLLEVSRTNAKGITGGVWKRVTVDWTISSSTAYWLGVQVNNTLTATWSDRTSTDGAGRDVRGAITTLPNPFDGGVLVSSTGMYAIYAVWEAAEEDTTPPSFSNNKTNASSTTYNGTDVQINLTITDDIAVDFYTLSHNDTAGGAWANESFVSAGDTSPITMVWNYSIHNFSVNGGTFGWRVWANDTAGNVNVSGIYTFAVQAIVTDTCTPTIGQTWTIEDNCTKSAWSFSNPDYHLNILDGSLILKDYSNLTIKYINISHRKYPTLNKSGDSRINITGI